MDDPAVDRNFEQMTTYGALSPACQNELVSRGFTLTGGPALGAVLCEMAQAYDQAMLTGSPDDLALGSGSTRLWDFVNRGPAFDAFYIHPPLLQACVMVIGAPFKLSSTLGRTLRPGAAAQELHADLPRDSPDLPMLGFILMLDPFRPDNGATRFVPGSHLWPSVPDGSKASRQARHPDEVLACGPAGSLILFNAAIWHGHTANASDKPRRSIQGYFVRRGVKSALDMQARMTPATLERISPTARYLLAAE